ncbi:hypothetical protein [Sulfitobacter pacificus]|uniref:hypothetical protein n=1 Tax=Sulfitobacter pacificus TaxID=1499314 RepID=UPI0031032AEF
MIPPEIIDAVSALKKMASDVAWHENGLSHETLIALSVSEIALEGLFLRIRIPQTIDAFYTMIQLEWGSGRNTVNLQRIEWKAGHNNPNIGPSELRSDYLASTHIHKFDDNYLINKGRMRPRNLPLARPIYPDPATLEDFFASAANAFIIPELSSVERPAFQQSLL